MQLKRHGHGFAVEEMHVAVVAGGFDVGNIVGGHAEESDGGGDFESFHSVIGLGGGGFSCTRFGDFGYMMDLSCTCFDDFGYMIGFSCTRFGDFGYMIGFSCTRFGDFGYMMAHCARTLRPARR